MELDSPFNFVKYMTDDDDPSTHRLPTQDRLHELLDYDPDSGKLTWHYRVEGPNSWNARFAGKEAFTADNGEGYHQGTVDGVKCFAHRVVWKWLTGQEPPVVDHENGVGLDNREHNLRGTNQLSNSHNMGLKNTNTSGYCGVHWDKQAKKWQARIMYNGEASHLGYYNSPEDAHAARMQKQKELGFSDRHGT